MVMNQSALCTLCESAVSEGTSPDSESDSQLHVALLMLLKSWLLDCLLSWPAPMSLLVAASGRSFPKGAPISLVGYTCIPVTCSLVTAGNRCWLFLCSGKLPAVIFQN